MGYTFAIDGVPVAFFKLLLVLVDGVVVVVAGVTGFTTVVVLVVEEGFVIEVICDGVVGVLT